MIFVFWLKKPPPSYGETVVLTSLSGETLEATNRCKKSPCIFRNNPVRDDCYCVREPNMSVHPDPPFTSGPDEILDEIHRPAFAKPTHIRVWRRRFNDDFKFQVNWNHHRQIPHGSSPTRRNAKFIANYDNHTTSLFPAGFHCHPSQFYLCQMVAKTLEIINFDYLWLNWFDVSH